MTEVCPSLVATASELFTDEACAELKAAFCGVEGASTCEVRVAAPGLIFVTLPTPAMMSSFQRAVVDTRPIFTRHLHRIDSVLNVAGLGPDDLKERLLDCTLELLRKVGGGAQRTIFQVRKVASEAAVSGGQMAVWLRSLVEEGAPEGTGSDLIVSCTALGHGIYLGLGDPVGNLSSRMGGAIHYNMSRFPVSRAGAKLAEAFEVFLPLDSIPRPARAIDLGAAPGGWTAVLVDHGFTVDAIDPGEMHPSLTSHSQVTAHRVKAQDWRPRGAKYQLLTCDVNWSAKETALAVLGLATHLSPEALAVVTIKLNQGPALPQIESVKGIFSSCFRVESIRSLFHNRREVTLLLRRLA